MKGRLTIPKIKTNAEVNQYTPLSRNVAVAVPSVDVPRSLIFIGSEITGPRTVRYPMDCPAHRTAANLGRSTETCSPAGEADHVRLCKNRRRRLSPRTMGNAMRSALNCSTIDAKPT